MSTTNRYFVWGLDLSQSLQGAGGISGLVAAVDNGTTYYYMYDANGNVDQVIDTNTGTVAASYEYLPFGGIVASSGSYKDGNVFRFSTKVFDEETRLYYCGYRYYSAELGRWVNRDPIEEEGGINLYAFVDNNPNSKFDALGQEVEGIFDKNQNQITLSEGGNSVSASAFSGGFCCKDGNIVKNEGISGTSLVAGGEIPSGRYLIVAEPSGAHSGNWYALFKDDWFFDDKAFSGLAIRSGFRLHLGSLSEGCVTVCKYQDDADIKWQKIRELIDNTEDYWILTYGGRKLKVYGKIRVK